MKQTTTPDQDSVEMQNEQAEREMRQTAPCYSEPTAAKDSSSNADLPKHNVFPKRILDDVLILLAGQRYPTPEKGFTGWDDALSSLKRFVCERVPLTQATSGSEPPDERVLQPETNSDARERSMALVVAWADSQKISLAKMGSAAVNNLVFRIAPYLSVVPELWCVACESGDHQSCLGLSCKCIHSSGRDHSVAPDNSLAEAKRKLKAEEQDHLLTIETFRQQERIWNQKMADFRDTVVRRLQQEAKNQQIAADGWHRQYENESRPEMKDTFITDRNYCLIRRDLATALAAEFAAALPKQDEVEK